jgi:hypothetical protein
MSLFMFGSDRRQQTAAWCSAQEKAVFSKKFKKIQKIQMTRSKTNKVTVLEQIAVVVGVRGSKSGTRRAHQLSQRARGKPIDLQTRLKVAAR